MVEQVKIQATTLRQEVFRAIRQQILAGQLRPGTKLVEAELAERLGVSRNPVREAIGRLEQQGLVRTIPNQGATVVQPTPAQLQETLLVRANLEFLALQLILVDSNPAPARFTALAATVAKMEALAAEIAVDNSPEQYADAHSRFTLLDADFHQQLVECAGNEALARTWHSVAPVDLLFVYDLVAIRNGTTGHLDLQPIIAQHVRLLTYLRNGNRPAAERELKAQFTAPNRAHSIHLAAKSLAVLGWQAE